MSEIEKESIAVRALNYSTPSNEPRRPRILTVLAILCIVVGVLGIVVNLLEATELALLFYKPPPMAPLAAIRIGSNPMAAPGYLGLMPAQQTAFDSALSNRHALSNSRRAQLDYLSSQYGNMILLVGGDFSSQKLDGYIMSVSTQTDPGGGLPMDVYVLRSGLLEISNNDATFIPNTPGFVIHAQLGKPIPNPFNPAQVNNFIGSVNSMTGQTLTPAQIQSVQTAAADASDGEIITSTITAAKVDAHGTLTVTTKAGSLIIPSGGGGTMQPAPIAVPVPQSADKTPIWFGADGIYGLAVSIYLLIIAISVLRGSRSGRKLLWIYCGLKVPIIVVMAMAAFWIDRLHPPDLFFLGCYACIFAVLVFLIIRTAKVRDYYGMLLKGSST